MGVIQDWLEHILPVSEKETSSCDKIARNVNVTALTVVIINIEWTSTDHFTAG